VANAVANIHLSPQAAAELLEGGAEAIDVRTEPEWEAGRIGGARRVEMNELSASAASIDRDSPVLFYCRTGNRSDMAAELFRQEGWDAYHLEGGLAAWVDAGLPIEPADGEVVPQHRR
jgi:rhodanese-related sulfurtransferase